MIQSLLPLASVLSQLLLKAVLTEGSVTFPDSGKGKCLWLIVAEL